MEPNITQEQTTKRWLKRRTILDAKNSTGAGTAVNIVSYKNMQLKVTSQGSFNGTIKVQGSLQYEEPTWGSAASATNIESITTFLGLLVSIAFPMISTLKFSISSLQ